MERRNKAWYNNFDVILGLGVLAVVAAGVPWLGQQLNVAKNVRSRDHAGRVAQAILDYHAEKGQWPAANGQPVDLAVVASAIAPAPTEGAMMAPGSKRPGEVPVMTRVRFRTLGCGPLTAADESTATTLDQVLAEMEASRLSERAGRLIDFDQAGSMEKKKQEGYF